MATFRPFVNFPSEEDSSVIVFGFSWKLSRHVGICAIGTMQSCDVGAELCVANESVMFECN